GLALHPTRHRGHAGPRLWHRREGERWGGSRRGSSPGDGAHAARRAGRRRPGPPGARACRAPARRRGAAGRRAGKSPHDERRRQGQGGHGVDRARGRVVAAAGGTRLRGRLVTGATPAYRLAARLRLDRLDDLAPRLPGWIAAEARVAGRGFDTPRRHVDADVRLIGASLHGVEVHDGELRARLDGNNLRLETAELTGNGTTVRATGTADLGRHTIDASLDWERADGADRARVDATATGDEGPPDRLAATLARSGETTTAALRELLATPPGGVPWRLLRPATVTVSPEAVTTDSVALAADAQRITLGGRIGFRGASDASLQIAGLDIAPLCAAPSDHTCGGTVSVQARIAGKAEGPRLTGDVR